MIIEYYDMAAITNHKPTANSRSQLQHARKKSKGLLAEKGAGEGRKILLLFF
jgi:hypothetical protein